MRISFSPESVYEPDPVVDQKHIAEAYEKHGPALFRRARTLLGNDEDAREIVQETFFQFWKGRGRFERRSSIFTFLYRITTNLSIDRMRRRITAGDQFALDEGRLESSARSDRRAQVLSELAELTEGLDSETITIAVMAHVDGLTQEEIAEGLCLSRRTIGKKLKRFAKHTGDRRIALEQEMTEPA